MLDRLVEILLTNSLEAERRHAQIKKWEGSKLTHISTASRNAIATRFLRWRQVQCDLLAATEREIQKLVRTNLQALVWKQPDTSRPVGLRFSASRQPDTMSATGGSSSAASAGPATVAAESDLVAHKHHLLAQARRKMEKLLDAFLLPVTRPQWEQWLDGCLSEFRATMVSAPAARRQRTMRLRARPDMPAAVSRIQPLRASTSDELHTDWACNLRHRTGWHGLKTRKHGILVVFTIVMDRRTHYIALDNLSSPTSPPRCLSGHRSLHRRLAS
jgi:hypothetical protein